MEAQLRELIPFLRDKNPQVRQIALSNLLPQTPKDSPHRSIFFSGLGSGGLQKPKENDLIRDLKLLCRDQLATAHDAFRALVNLSDSSLLAPYLSEPAFLTYLVSYIINPQSILADLASMLLSNLTGVPSVCSALLQMNVKIIEVASSPNGYFAPHSLSGTCPAPVPYPKEDEREVLALPLLADAFVQGAQGEDLEDKSKKPRKADLHFLASVFANITTSSTGRTFFLTPRPPDVLKPNGPAEFPLTKLVSYTEHPNIIRRGGVASTIKNCCFEPSCHRALLSSDDELVKVAPSKVAAPGINVLVPLLLPLAGPEEFDLEDQEHLPSELQLLPPTKKREPDPTLRLTFVETLLLLCSTRWGRDYQREHGVYEIIRAAHKVEKNDKVAEFMERLVNMLKREEGAQIEEEVDVDVEAQAAAGAFVEDEDDEDNKIEEV